MQDNKKRGSTELALKAGFWYAISNFLVRGMGFLTTPIFSRLMSSEHYGEFSNYASWQALLIIITGAELHNTVGRSYYDFKEDFDGYVSTITIASCGLTAILYLLFILCGNWIFGIVSIPAPLVHILFFTLMCQACKSIYMARERTLYRYKSVAALSAFIVVIPTLIAVAAVMLSQESMRLNARIYGFYLPTALIGLGCAFVMMRRGKTFNPKYLKYAFTLSLPLMVHYLTAHLLTSSNTIVTKAVLGAESVAIVSVASSANHILTILLSAISGALTTWMMDNLEQGNIRTVRRGTLAYVAGISLVAAGVMLLSPEIIWVLGGARYAQSTLLMPGVVASSLIQSVTTIFTIILTYKKRVVGTAAYTAVVSILCILAKVYLLPVYGVQCVPYTNVAAFAVLLVINYSLVRKAGCAGAVNLKGIACILLCVTAMMAASYFLYAHTVLRYIIIVCCAAAMIAVLYIKRDLVKKVLKSKLGKKKAIKKATEQ